jgi:hypothetical protein
MNLSTRSEACASEDHRLSRRELLKACGLSGLVLAIEGACSTKPEKVRQAPSRRAKISSPEVVNAWSNPNAEGGISGATCESPDAKDMTVAQQQADAWRGRKSFEFRFMAGPSGNAVLVFGAGKGPVVSARAGQTCFFRVAGKVARSGAGTALELRARWFDDAGRLIVERPAVCYGPRSGHDSWSVLDGWDTAPERTARVALALHARRATGATTLRAGGVQMTLDPARFPGYVDGDEPGCAWDGPSGASASRGPRGIINLMPNPNFERGLDGWRKVASPGAAIHVFKRNLSWANGNKASLQVKGNAGRQSSISVASEPITVVGGQEYTLQATINAAKMPARGRVALILGWLDSNGKHLSAESMAGVADSLGVRQLEVTKPAPRNAATAEAEVRTSEAVPGEYDFSVAGFSLIADSGARPGRPFWTGFNDQVLNRGPLTLTRDIAYDRQLGVNAVRLPVNLFLNGLYERVWPAPDAAINLDPVAAPINALFNAGVRVLLLSPIVPWMIKNRQLDPDHYADVARLSAAFVRRWPNLIGVEPGNEVNSSNFWPPAANPVMFVRYLSLVYRAVKNANPAIPVLAPSCNAPLTQKGNMSISDYTKAFYAAGGGQFCDALSIHPYPYGASSGSGNDRSRNFWAGSNDCMRQLREVRDAFHDSAKPIWITELGSPTNNLPIFPPLLQTVTEEQQATNEVLLYDWARRQDDVQAIFFHTNASDPKWDFGIIQGNGRLKPAFFALQAELHRKPAPYFDGDTRGCRWLGARGSSPSIFPFS